MRDIDNIYHMGRNANVAGGVGDRVRYRAAIPAKAGSQYAELSSPSTSGSNIDTLEYWVTRFRG